MVNMSRVKESKENKEDNPMDGGTGLSGWGADIIKIII